MLKGRVLQLFSSLSRRAVFTIVLSGIAVLLLLRLVFVSPQGNGKSFRNGGPDTLVLYSFSYTDSLFLDNLAYFLNEGVRPGDRCQYMIIVQQAEDAVAAAALPELPGNAQYVFHDSECNDWGVWGWMLFDSKQIDHRRFRYFVFMTAAVRGPFMPAYAPATMHWTDPFIQRLNVDVKLVGPTISCESSPLNGNAANEWRKNPHVQTYLVVTDQVGLAAMVKDGAVFKCYDNRWNSIYHGELGSSAAILNAGYNLASLMVRYQGVDWRNQPTWDCNGRFSPQGENHNDGLTLDPLEVMFIKMKSDMIKNELTFAKKAAKYAQWRQASESTLNLTELATNEYLSHLAKFKVPKILVLKARGSDCFDIPFYLDNNRDLAVFSSNEALWRHYVYFGQFEARPARFTCDMDYTKHLSGAGVMMSEAGLIKRNLQAFQPHDGALPHAQSHQDLSSEGAEFELPTQRNLQAIQPHDGALPHAQSHQDLSFEGAEVELPTTQRNLLTPMAAGDLASEGTGLAAGMPRHLLTATASEADDIVSVPEHGDASDLLPAMHRELHELHEAMVAACNMGHCGPVEAARVAAAAAGRQLLDVPDGTGMRGDGWDEGQMQHSMHSTATATHGNELPSAAQ